MFYMARGKTGVWISDDFLIEDKIEEKKSKTVFITIGGTEGQVQQLKRYFRKEIDHIDKVITTTDRSDDVIEEFCIVNDIPRERISQKLEDNFFLRIENEVDVIIIGMSKASSPTIQSLIDWGRQGLFDDFIPII